MAYASVDDQSTLPKLVSLAGWTLQREKSPMHQPGIQIDSTLEGREAMIGQHDQRDRSEKLVLTSPIQSSIAR